MSASAANPWSAFSDMLRLGLDSYVATQKTMLDIAAQQNALWTAAITQGTQQAGAVLNPADLAAAGAKAFLESQKLGLDIALQQNRLAITMAKAWLGPASPYLADLTHLLENGAEAFVNTQKKLLEFASAQSDAMIQSVRQSSAAMPNPLAQIAELSRQSTDAFIQAQKQFLDLLSRQPNASNGQPAADFMNVASACLQSYLATQRTILNSMGQYAAATPR